MTFTWSVQVIEFIFIMWSEWFISKVREDLRDRVTTLDEIWGIMIFSPEKQAVAEAAARVAEDIISGLEEEVARQREIIDELKLKIAIKNISQVYD
jgi:hypothetical protein